MGAALGDGIVIDCSVAMSWCFLDEDDDYARTVLRALAGVQACVPTLWCLEVANALLVGERRNRLTRAASSRFLGLLDALPLRVERHGEHPATREVLHLGRLHGISAYDAAYLELAIRLGVPLATLDAELREAAAAARIEIFGAS